MYSNNKYIALETRKNLSRGISTPVTENTARGPLDSFTENIEINIGLIKRRIKSNDLWINKYIIGTESLDSFDEFVATIEKLGIEEATSIQQGAYERYMNR